MAHVGVFGGTFNPPHVGHLICAKSAMEQLELDTVVFVPAGRPPHKVVEDDPGKSDRLTMCELLTSPEERFVVSDFEINSPKPSYTLATLKRLKRDYPEDKLTFIVGADMAVALPMWHRPREVLTLAGFAVADRRGSDRESIRRAFESLDATERLRFFEMPEVDVSSTLIRDMTKEGNSIAGLVPEGVQKYIEAKGLYN